MIAPKNQIFVEQVITATMLSLTREFNTLLNPMLKLMPFVYGGTTMVAVYKLLTISVLKLEAKQPKLQTSLIR